MTDTFTNTCAVIFGLAICGILAEIGYGLYYAVDKLAGAAVVKFILALLS